MRVVVTGGAGFIGSFLCERLLAEGHEVICLDNFVTGDEANLEKIRNEPRFRCERRDVSEPFSVPGPVDTVLHLASPASPVDYARLPLETLKVNSAGTMHCLELARAKDADFLITCTSEAYGDPLVHPQREDYWGNVNPVGPRSCYDEGKRFAEALTMAYHRRYGMRTRIARIFNTYGPRMRLEDGRVVPALVAQGLRGEPLTVFGDGTQTRSFCYVDDMVEGLRRMMDSSEPYPINLGSPVETTILEFANIVASQLGCPPRIEFASLPQDDPKRRCPDITRARKLLQWQPVVSLQEGLHRTVAYFQSRLVANSAQK